MVPSLLFSATLLAALHLAPANKDSSVDSFIDRFKARFQHPEVPAPVGSTGATGGGTAGGGTKVNKSSATCYSIAFGSSNATTNAAIAKSVADVSAYVCNTGPKNEAVEKDIASATATAYAKAVADASVVCEGEGNVDVYGRAYARAEANTTAFLQAYAEAFAEATTCDKTCDAAAIAYGYIEQEVFLSAVAESEAIVNGYQDAAEIGGIQGFRQFRAKAMEFNSDVQVAVATSFAEAIAGAKDFYDTEGCFAWVNAGGCIWSPDADDPDECPPEGLVVGCEVLSVGKTKVTEINAFAEAVAAASAYTCGNDTEAEAEADVAARALAEATAEALSFAYAKCTADEGGVACGVGFSAAEAAAKAVAEAFAEAWAEGYTCDDTCTVEAESRVSKITEILATAFTTAYAEVCAANGESWSMTVLTQSIQTATVEAVANAIAESVVGGDECFAATGTVVSIDQDLVL